MNRYDLTDTEWNAIQDLLPPEKSGKRGHPCKDNRTMESGMVWVLRSGSPWRDLPKEYGSWNGVYTRFNRWSKRGVGEQALAVLVQAWDPENIHIDGVEVFLGQDHAVPSGCNPVRQAGPKHPGLDAHCFLPAMDPIENRP